MPSELSPGERFFRGVGLGLLGLVGAVLITFIVHSSELAPITVAAAATAFCGLVIGVVGFRLSTADGLGALLSFLLAIAAIVGILRYWLSTHPLF